MKRMKDHDVTWLYGPLQHGFVKRRHGRQLSKPKSPTLISKKPILRKKARSEMMLQKSLSAASLLKQATALIQAQRAETRLFDPFKDDAIEATSIPPTNEFTLSTLCPIYAPDIERPQTRKKRGIHFNEKVEQFIALDDDDEDSYLSQDNEDDSDSDSGDAERMKRTMIQLKKQPSLNKQGSEPDGKTIAALPNTTLKYAISCLDPAQPTKIQTNNDLFLNDGSYSHSPQYPRTIEIDDDGDGGFRNPPSAVLCYKNTELVTRDRSSYFPILNEDIKHYYQGIGQHVSHVLVENSLNNRRDAAAMKTVTLLTAAFIPGTFIATIFSLRFFNYQTSTPTISKHFWIYWAVMIPLSGLVVAFWYVWERIKEKDNHQHLFSKGDTQLLENLGLDLERQKNMKYSKLIEPPRVDHETVHCERDLTIAEEQLRTTSPRDFTISQIAPSESSDSTHDQDIIVVTDEIFAGRSQNDGQFFPQTAIKSVNDDCVVTDDTDDESIPSNTDSSEQDETESNGSFYRNLCEDNNESPDLSPILDQARQELVDRVMEEFWILFNREWNSNFRTYGGSTSSSSHSGNTPFTTPGTSIASPPSQRKRQRDDGDTPDGNEDGNPRPPRRRVGPNSPSDSSNRFACPFRKHDSRRYTIHTHRVCALSHWETIARVK
jgi:hypothetical protein